MRLLKRSELPADWDPLTDDDTNIWEATQHLVKRLEEGGEEKAAALLSALGSTAEIARDLAYRLYSFCERKKWAQEALAYKRAGERVAGVDQAGGEPAGAVYGFATQRFWRSSDGGFKR